MGSWELESMIFLRVDRVSYIITFVFSLSWSHTHVLKMSDHESSLSCRVNCFTRFFRSWGGSEEWII